MDLADRPGGIFIRVADQISMEDRILLQTVARVIVSDKGGDLDVQVGRRSLVKPLIQRPTDRIRALYSSLTDWAASLLTALNM